MERLKRQKQADITVNTYYIRLAIILNLLREINCGHVQKSNSPFLDHRIYLFTRSNDTGALEVVYAAVEGV
jgi:hypothetical protein